jgi:hypothetical protein
MKYRVDTIEHWTTEIDASSAEAARELVNDGDKGTKRTLTMFTTEQVWECKHSDIVHPTWRLVWGEPLLPTEQLKVLSRKLNESTN